MPQITGQPTTISDKIFGKCSAALGVTSSHCDGVSALHIDPTTSADLKSIYAESVPAGGGEPAYDRWRIIGLLLEADFIGKSCEIQINGMYDWLQSITKRAGPKRLTLSQINSGLWELFPFIRMERKAQINNQYWNVASGSGTAGTSPGGKAYNYTFRAATQTNIPPDVRWFPPRLRVEITSRTAGGSKAQWEYEVVDAVLDATVPPAYVTVYANSLNQSSFMTTVQGLPTAAFPTTGLLVRGTPNVSDYESYCPEIPGLNTKQLSPFFIETTRWSYRICELMEKYLAAIRANNPYFKEFGDVDSVELNRQIQQDFERREVWSFFFTKPLPNQDMANYDKLQTITVQDGTVIKNPYGGRVVGRRASATGIYEQHLECNRVYDLQGNTMNLREVFDAIYQMLRVRESIGTQTGYVELWTDDLFAMKLQQGIFNYFAAKLQDPTTGANQSLLNVNYDLMNPKSEQGPLGFRWRKFQLDFPNVELRVVTHPFFNDISAGLYKAGGVNLQTVGRVAWMIDWNVNYPMIFEVNSVTLTSGDLNRLAESDFASYGCVMKVPRDRQKLMSKTLTNVSECPAASLLIENFADAVPEWKGISGQPGDYYGTLP